MSEQPPHIPSTASAAASQRVPSNPHAIIRAAGSERDRLVLKNPSRPVKTAHLAAAHAGWARLHTEYLTLSDDEARLLMQGVPE